MRKLTATVLLLALSSTAVAGPFSRRHTAPEPEPAVYVDPVTLEADYSEAWRDYLSERRAVQLERLEAYADAGVFPVNTEVPGLANLFMDDEGRRCAMAHLIWEDGEENLVKVFAAVDNDVRLGEVTEGPLLDWMLTSGLTQGEAAFIQVPDFQVDIDLPIATQEELIAQEQTRLRNHFAAALAQTRAYEEQSLDAAVHALGERVQSPPPTAEDAPTTHG